MARPNGTRTPISIAVFASMATTAAILIIAAAVGLSVGLTLHLRAQQNAQQKQIARREATTQLRASVPTCKALIELDRARIGATNASHDPSSYGHKLARAIHDVVDTTKCYRLIRMVDHHVPYTVILHRLEGSNQ